MVIFEGCVYILFHYPQVSKKVLKSVVKSFTCKKSPNPKPNPFV